MNKLGGEFGFFIVLLGTAFMAIAVVLLRGVGDNPLYTQGRIAELPGDSLPAPVVRINQVMSGENGLSKIQYVELEVSDSAQKCWGPAHPGSPCYIDQTETTGRMMLIFFNAAGNQTGRYVFPHDPGGTSNTVLVATAAFAALPGAPTPDFIISPEVMPESGQVCLRGNPDNPNAGAINLCLAYGAFGGPQQNNAVLGDPVAGPFTGSANGQPVVDPSHPSTTLPITDTVGLNRTVLTFGPQFNADFTREFDPIPHNTSGDTYTFTVASTVEQGENLFDFETFLGNGRTCGTCHVEADGYGLSSETVAALPPTDPLFMAEYDLNTLVLDAPSFPSDMRGPITATNGLAATQVYGTLDTYQVYGGSAALIGQVVTDAQGNSGMVSAFLPGNLSPQPGVPFSGLEDPTLMHAGRALILENIDGFDQPAVMRHSPNLINVGVTDPYGMSSLGIDNLNDFSTGALAQHMPRSLTRVSGVDFRPMTQQELDAMTAFMNTIQVGASRNWDLDYFATTEAQKRGRNLFFGPAVCLICHRGPRLDDSIDKDRSDFFGTGVADQQIDITDGLPLERQAPADTTNSRLFNSRQLWGLRNDTSLFHEGSAHTLHDAVNFYTSTEFANSRHGLEVTTEMFPLSDQDINDITAFLAALEDQPFDFTRTTDDFGSQDPNGGPSPSQTIVITNTGTVDLAIDAVAMNGAGADQFTLTDIPPTTTIGIGETSSIGVAFDPNTAGLFCATLEYTVTDQVSSETYPVGVPVRGTGSGGVIGPPTISSIPDQVVQFNKPTPPISFTVSEPGATANCLTLSGVASDPAKVPDNQITFGGVDDSIRTVMAVMVPNQSGTITITVTVSDGLQSASTSFHYTVLSGSQTPTPTSTSTNTSTPTSTETPTETSTPTPTETFTPLPSDTLTPTPSETFSASDTPTSTPTGTAIATDTSTPLPTETPTPSLTETTTPTPTETFTPLPSDTPTPTPNDTLSASDTPTSTDTGTPFPADTETATPPPTETPTPSPSGTSTPTSTATQTGTLPSTNTPTTSPVVTFTPTETATSLSTDTATPIPGETMTPTGTQLPTDTPTSTYSPTPTLTGTLFPQPTDTFTPLPTGTSTPITGNTATPTPTGSATRAPTYTPTSTQTPVFLSTVTPTPTSTFTPTASSTILPSITLTNTPTRTFTPTGSPTTTPTSTFTATATQTILPITLTPTETPTLTPTATQFSVVIYPETGGSLTVTLGFTLTLEFQPGAVDQPVTILVGPDTSESPPDGYSFLGQAFYIEAYDQLGGSFTDFLKPYTLTINYAMMDIGSLNETTLGLYFWYSPTSQWEPPAGTRIDIQNKVLTATMNHVSTFSLLGKQGYYLYLPMTSAGR